MVMAEVQHELQSPSTGEPVEEQKLEILDMNFEEMG